MLVLLLVALWFIIRGDLSLALCYFILVFFSPFNFAITSLGEERAFVWLALVMFCLFSLPSLCLGWTVACDCDTPWTFLLPSFFLMDICGQRKPISNCADVIHVKSSWTLSLATVVVVNVRTSWQVVHFTRNVFYNSMIIHENCNVFSNTVTFYTRFYVYTHVGCKKTFGKLAL